MGRKRTIIYGRPIEVEVQVGPDTFRWVRPPGESLEALADRISDRERWDATWIEEGHRPRLVIERPRGKDLERLQRRVRSKLRTRSGPPEELVQRTESEGAWSSEDGDPIEDLREFDRMYRAEWGES